MKSIFLIFPILIFSFCAKKEVPSKLPVDHIDTTLGNMTFALNGKSAHDFHVSGKKFKNKIVVLGEKMELVGNELVPFHHWDICFNNNSLKKQPLCKVYQGDDSKYSDSSKAWSTFATSGDSGQGICEFFEINNGDSINNWVQVTKQQSDFGEIWGNISVSLKKIQKCYPNFYPDTVVIRNGYFHIFVK